MLFLNFTCYHGNHFVESTLTKIIKNTKLCNFYFFICIRDGPLFLSGGGGLPFLGLADNFFQLYKK